MDKSGILYIYHPIHLAEQMDDEKSTCVSLLHDVVEDTDMTFIDLARYDFDDEIIGALKLITHDKSVPYMDYVRKIKKNPIAAKAKKVELEHNSDLTRLADVNDKAKERVEKYKKAIVILNI